MAELGLDRPHQLDRFRDESTKRPETVVQLCPSVRRVEQTLQPGLRPRGKNHPNRRVAACVGESVERDIDALVAMTSTSASVRRSSSRCAGRRRSDAQLAAARRPRARPQPSRESQGCCVESGCRKITAHRVRAQMRGQHSARRRSHSRQRRRLRRLRDPPGEIAESVERPTAPSLIARSTIACISRSCSADGSPESEPVTQGGYCRDPPDARR